MGRPEEYINSHVRPSGGIITCNLWTSWRNKHPHTPRGHIRSGAVNGRQESSEILYFYFDFLSCGI